VPFRPIDGGRAEEVSRRAPEDWPDESRKFWETYAPAAIEAGTLTTQTLASWCLLCEVDARRRKLLKQIEEQGETYLKCWVDASGQEHEELKKHPLSSEYRGLAQRAEALMAKFSLAPFGKPVAGGRRGNKAKVNPWAGIMGTGR
jgi:hypothetical protein